MKYIYILYTLWIHTSGGFTASSSSSSDVVPESEGLSSCPPTGKGLSSVSSEDEFNAGASCCRLSDTVALDNTALTSGDVVFATADMEKRK